MVWFLVLLIGGEGRVLTIYARGDARGNTRGNATGNAGGNARKRRAADPNWEQEQSKAIKNNIKTQLGLQSRKNIPQVFEPSRGSKPAIEPPFLPWVSRPRCSDDTAGPAHW